MLKFPINSQCTGCSACYNACHMGAISFEYNHEGFLRPIIKKEVCIECGMCKRVCQLENTEILPKNVTVGYYYSGTEEVVFNSSSGGAFSFLSDYVLSKGGVVYGARFNQNNFTIEHCNTDDFPLSDFRKSKYAESNLQKSFSSIKETLENGRHVLFSGTPCQVKGLRLFLGGKYDNLLTVDFVCHGTPSSAHLSEYLYDIQKKYKKKIISLDFRPKEKGWKKIFLKLIFNDSSSLLIPYRHSYYYWAFYNNICLKESCYTCDLNNHSYADITLGDFWGISDFQPSLDKNKGLSLVLANTEMAKSMLINIKTTNLISIPTIAYEYVYKGSAHHYNQALRTRFIHYLKKFGYLKSISFFYWRQMIFERLKDFFKRNNDEIWVYPNQR